MAEQDSRTGHGEPDEQPRGGRHRRRRRRALVVTAWTVAAVLLLGAAGLGFVYYRLNGNIAGVDINGRLGGDRPEDMPHGSVDILVLGSDSRSGENARYGDDDGSARSDTAMIVHVNEAHDHATIVSVPRDTLVARPPCRKADGTLAPGAAPSMFNEAYQVGGPACAVKTVEAMTDIRMDHYIEVDFTGFKELVDTFGGVQITLSEPLQDADSHLDLAAGSHTLDGEQALALVRTRHAVGNGSDLGRIQLQHAFLRALLGKVDDIGLFSDPAQLYDLADTATSAVTTDTELDSAADLLGMAKLLRDVGPGEIDMLTMPVRYDPDDPNRVLPLKGKADQVWDALRADRTVPESATDGSAGARSDADVVRRERG
ncbi:LytR family transcriptional regulator [Streptomyces sp. RKND-216]|uniref:LCP family protein n=1 Tax=Streptomyces sp. RKND-216 TaxID=2562581 RepID=UPI00109E02B9|nr:LCP family protein [Streptomyces sp. RKND-216]THA24503.1 LytR family transcriptional regulator [Streptomyces sp. RKND-216]